MAAENPGRTGRTNQSNHFIAHLRMAHYPTTCDEDARPSILISCRASAGADLACPRFLACALRRAEKRILRPEMRPQNDVPPRLGLHCRLESRQPLDTREAVES